LRCYALGHQIGIALCGVAWREDDASSKGGLLLVVFALHSKRGGGGLRALDQVLQSLNAVVRDVSAFVASVAGCGFVADICVR
jgi:hypothetical protein